MLSRESLTSIQKLISKAKKTYPATPLFDEVPGCHDALKNNIVMEELKEECNKLYNLFKSNLFQSSKNESYLKTAFLKLCAERYKQNPQTVVGYGTAVPEKVCNQLYWDIALRLFAPKDMAEMFAILMPGAKQLSIDFERDQENKKNNINQLRITLKPKEIKKLYGYPPDIKLLPEFVFSNNLIFPLQKISKYSFQDHLKLYDALIAFPDIKNELYTHNEDFKQLEFDINWVNNNGLPMDNMLKRLIFDFERFGQKNTGEKIAPHDAFLAFQKFLAYLERFPKDIEKKLLQMSGKGKSLAGVIGLLKGEECIETVADYLKSIRANENNTVLLKNLPKISTEQLQQITQKYNNPIKVIGKSETSALPEKLKEKLISKIKIKTNNDFADLILNLPPEEYKTILKYASIYKLPSNLLIVLQMCSLEQQTELLFGMIKYKEKFGGKDTLAILCLQSGNEAASKKIATYYSDSERLAFLAKNSFLYNEALGLKISLRGILAFSGSRGRESILQHEKLSYYLEQLIINDERDDLSCFLNYCPRDIVLEIIKKYHLVYFSIRQKCPEILAILLRFYPKQEQFIIKKYSDLFKNHGNFLNNLVKINELDNRNFLSKIIPQDILYDLIIKKLSINHPSFSVIKKTVYFITDKKYQEKLFKALIAKKELAIDAIKEFFVLSYKESTDISLELIQLLKGNRSYFRREVFENIFYALPQDNRLLFLTKYFMDSNINIMLAAIKYNDAQLIKRLFSGLPNKDRLIAIMTPLGIQNPKLVLEEASFEVMQEVIRFIPELMTSFRKIYQAILAVEKAEPIQFLTQKNRPIEELLVNLKKHITLYPNSREGTAWKLFLENYDDCTPGNIALIKKIEDYNYYNTSYGTRITEYCQNLYFSNGLTLFGATLNQQKLAHIDSKSSTRSDQRLVGIKKSLAS